MRFLLSMCVSQRRLPGFAAAVAPCRRVNGAVRQSDAGDTRPAPPSRLAGTTHGAAQGPRRRHRRVSATAARLARAYGYADREWKIRATPDTLFQAGSISKPLTALAALRGVDAGTLDLDRNVI